MDVHRMITEPDSGYDSDNSRKSILKKYRVKFSLNLFIIFIVGTFLFDFAAYHSTVFSDWYRDRIFPVLGAAYGRLTSLTEVSVGEWMVVCAVVYLAAVVILCAGMIFLHGKRGYGRFIRRLGKTTAWIAAIVFLVMSLNCVVLYHCTPLETTLPGYGRTFSVAELAELRDKLAGRLNTLAEMMPRGEDGEVVIDEKGINREAGECVAALSDLYPCLGGYQVRPKAMFFSVLMCQGYMQGYYFPFSMEANYNALMKPMHKPFTMCHELVHTNGYIYEDDANFLAFLACARSDDPVMQYSGLLGVWNYVNNSFYQSVGEEEYASHTVVSDLVWNDSGFLADSTWQHVEDSSPLDTETVHQTASVSLDATLKANGVTSGTASYSHVVALILEFCNGDLSVLG